VLASVIAPGEVGNVSVNARPATAVLLTLVKVSVRVVEPPGAMYVAPNVLLAVGVVSTVSVAFTPLVSIVAGRPERLVGAFMYPPGCAEVTLPEGVQLACAAASAPPESATDPDPATAVIVPPHALVAPGGVATTRFVGSESVNARPACAGLPLPL